MKKCFLAVLLIAAFSITANAQLINFGLKAGANLTNPSSIKNSISNPSTLWESRDQAGFTGGVYLKVNPGLLGLFFEAEALYSNFKVEVTQVGGLGKFTKTTNKFEVPVHVGVTVLKIFQVYAGPSFNFLSEGKVSNSLVEFRQDDKAIATAGDLGLRLVLGKISVDARYQFNFSNQRTSFGEATEDLLLHSYRSNPSMFYFTVGYSLFGKKSK